MKTNMLFAMVLGAFSANLYAVDGHNGITFKMNQKQLESKGFSCAPETEITGIISVCNHMEMRGNVFGHQTENYEVRIGKNKRVEDIKVDLVDLPPTLDAYLALINKVEKFFPKKLEQLSFNQDGIIRDFYKANDNSGLMVLITPPIPPISKGNQIRACLN